jgi:hypothetical protein
VDGVAADLLRLPHADRAIVPPGKLRDYALNPEHDLGRHKARLSASELAIGRSDWRYLADQLLAGVQTHTVSRIDVGTFGASYEVVVPVVGLNGSTVPVVSAWSIAQEEPSSPPRLITAYVYRP